MILEPSYVCICIVYRKSCLYFIEGIEAKVDSHCYYNI